ncbi:helix-turn-helix domain-containing protein [Paractinoplanes globisporus]|uniref:Helix-turn-helix domain-containing protein n=1 Tax=Paractinoplanes globisporus TaxID=113565 RepID=A0ABW6WBC2_9ACTN|nr:helix-turn-helix transcriptional regulator [Actinoplanes globisporus]
MPAATNHGRALAERLRKLRKSRWPDVSITQAELAEALSGRKKASVQLISSWERTSDPTPPPEDRLNAILTFFSTRRSISTRPYRLISEQDLTADEAAARAELEAELFSLRSAAVSNGEAPEIEVATSPPSIVGRGPWHYKVGPVVIVCAERGGETPPATNDPDRPKLSRFADLDSLMELHGHIRAVNPDLNVRFVGASEMVEDDWTAHVVLLGGIDWNEATQEAMRLTPVPVRQVSDDADPSRGCFEVVDEGETQPFVPEFEDRGGGRVLVQDVGHFFRAPNPMNRERTITVCNGMYGSGVYGAVRTLTHDVFREKNSDYLAQRFRGDTFSLLFRVQVLNGVATTPDWTDPETVLHTWPEA